MADKWRLVPVEATKAMVDAHFDADNRAPTIFAEVEDVWSAMLSAVPPMPESVWAEMVERGARALALEAGEEEWPAKPEFYRFQASSCLRAALGLDERAAADEGERHG